MTLSRVGFSALATLIMEFGAANEAIAAPVDGSACSIADALAGPIWSNKIIRTQPIITYLNEIDVAPGTTGTYTRTLNHVDTVTRQVTDSFGAEVSAEAGVDVILAKVSFDFAVKYSHTIVTTEQTTDTTETSVTWNFNEPGNYGLFRGTYKSSGVETASQCTFVRDGGSIRLAWKNTNYQYTVFTIAEEGTVRCEGPVPTLPDESLTIPEIVRKRLGPC